MLFISFVLENSFSFLSVLLALYISLVPNSETVLASVFVAAFFDLIRLRHYFKDKKSCLLPVPILLVFSTIIFALTAIIFGAPLLSDTENTLLFGLLLSVLVVLPIALTSGGNHVKTHNVLVDFVAESPEQQQELGAAAGAVFGAWCGAFVIPLDWDRPWQVWPVPCCVGAHLGSALGRLCWPALFSTGDDDKQE